MRKSVTALLVLVVIVAGAAVLLSSAEGDEATVTSDRPTPAVDHAVGWKFSASIRQQRPTVFVVTIGGERMDGNKRVGFFRQHLQSIPRSRYPFAPLPKQTDPGQLGPGHPTRSFAFRYEGGPPLPDMDRLVFEATAGATPFPQVRFGFPAG